jgi:hypothetical protein
MKLACASGSFHREIECGNLTQLEFLDRCARELSCDGVVLDVRHFPRADEDYLAQLKKLATDRGMCIAALSDSSFFGSPLQHMEEILHHAAVLGAPLVAAPLSEEVLCTWSEQLERLNSATSLAKARNVTLAVRNAVQTFAASAHDYKRVAKEADSAWLRFGPEPQQLDSASDPQTLAANTVLLWSDAATQTPGSIAKTAGDFSRFRGHVAIDERSGAAGWAQMRDALGAWREILNRR